MMFTNISEKSPSLKRLRTFLASFALSLCFIQISAFGSGQTSGFDSVVVAPEQPAANLKNTVSTSDDDSKMITKGFFRVEQLQYPTSVQDQPELNQSLLLTGHLEGDYKGTNFGNGFNVSVTKDVKLGPNSFGVNEIYINFFSTKESENSAKQELVLGRKILPWSHIDENWQLGLWQPKNAPDTLRPETQGLTGLFATTEMQSNSFRLFWSPLFIPTMGPDIQQKEGSLKSDSRWYREPSNSFPLSGKQTKIVYSLDAPDINKLTKQNSYGAYYSWNQSKNSRGTWFAASYGEAPVNSLLVKYKRYLILPETDPQTGDVTVTPEVGRHRIWSSDFGYKFSNSEIVFSYLEDKPVRSLPENPWVQQQLSPIRVLGMTWTSQQRLPLIVEPVAFLLSYMKTNSDKTVDYDSTGIEQGSIFEDRLNFTNAFRAEAKIRSVLFSKRTVSSLKFLRDFEQSGGVYSAEYQFFPQKQMAFLVGVDILGVDNTDPSNNDKKFLNQYRANDRYYGGVDYVF